MPAACRTPPHSVLRAFALAYALLFALSGCAPGALQREAGKVKLPTTESAFNVKGRLSARHGADAFAASFRWHHEAERDQLEFTSPLGQTVAVLSGDSEGVRLQAADGRVLSADNWAALTERGLGWRLPVDGLAFWIQGAPRAGEPYTVEPGGADRVGVLRQDGWTIVYLTYAEDQEPVARPSRMTLSYPDIELRLAVDSWH
jgi:outer membrane lipoprotein LolB